MANIPISPTWSTDVYQIETTDAVLGGPDGVINVQAKQLADRTAYLKQEVETAGLTASQAKSKAELALTQIDTIEVASGSAADNAMAALVHKQGAEAAQAMAEQARNAAQAAQAQASDNAGFAYQASQTAQLKASEAESAATAAVSAAGTALSHKNAAETARNAAQAAQSGAEAARDAASVERADAEAAASAAQANLDAFEDRYLGAKMNDPSADNHGNSLMDGALYWNIPLGEMRVWGGSSWQVYGASSANISHIPVATGAVPTTVQAKLREFTSAADKGSAPRVLIEFQDGAGAGPNIVVNPTINAIADDLSSVTISGGGNALNQNLIGFSEGKVKQVSSGCHYSGILYGYDNIIVQGVMQHASGAHQRVVGGDHNTVFGGSYHRVSAGAYGSIFGGSGGVISAAGSGSAIIGGTGNSVTTAGPGFILGGSNQTASAAFATVLGGTGNTASANGAIVTGRNNNVSGSDSFCAGGNNTISATYSTAAGLQNAVSGSGYASAFGRQNTVSGQYSYAFGYLNTASAASAFVHGRDAQANKSFSHVIGGEKFTSLGDVQSSVIVVRRQSTDATPIGLRIGSATARLTIPDDTTWAFSALIVARRTDADNESAAYEVRGCIDRNAGTVALVGTPTVTVIAEDVAAWDVTAIADNTNKSLEINVTGEAGKTINWVGRVTLTEVTG